MYEDCLRNKFQWATHQQVDLHYLPRQKQPSVLASKLQDFINKACLILQLPVTYLNQTDIIKKNLETLYSNWNSLHSNWFNDEWRLACNHIHHFHYVTKMKFPHMWVLTQKSKWTIIWVNAVLLYLVWINHVHSCCRMNNKVNL